MNTATLEQPQFEIDRELDTANRGRYPHPLDGLCEIDRIFRAKYLLVGDSIHNTCHHERGVTINRITTTAGVEVGILTVHWTRLDGGVEIQAIAHFHNMGGSDYAGTDSL